jgi:hypothetical protein
MKKPFIFVFLAIIVVPAIGVAQNCCAPAVPQQGVLGETVALPHVLDVGIHYEYLRTETLYSCCEEIDDFRDTESTWNRMTLSLSYGIMPRLSASLIIPYPFKKKSLNITQDFRKEYTSDGVGDIIAICRYSLIPRNFVTYREVSISAGIKFPTGATDRIGEVVALPLELQPGTGSWDFSMSASFYQGFEQVDFIVSTMYIYTTRHENYRFGNQFSLMLTSNIHLNRFLDLSLGLTGTGRGQDDDLNGYEIIIGSSSRFTTRVPNTGREQVWFSPGVHWQIIPAKLRFQLLYEVPVYQHFDGIQLGGGFNVRASLAWSLPLAHSEEE